jgi:UDP-N-acetylmuramate dehydrogenase
VRFRLRPDGAPTLRYADLQRHFSAAPSPTLAAVAATVRDIRRSKGMLIVPGDPDTRSATLAHLAAATHLDPTAIPHWLTTTGDIKLPAAWLLEQAGFTRGYGVGTVGISTRHTLALTNRGNATCADIERLQNEIMAKTSARFGITLEREPVLLG